MLARKGDHVAKAGALAALNPRPIAFGGSAGIEQNAQDVLSHRVDLRRIGEPTTSSR